MEIPVGKSFTEQEFSKVEEALKISLSQQNKNLLMNGYSSDIIEINGKESKITLARNRKGDVLATINSKKEALEIPDIIEGAKLSKNHKKSLSEGRIILINSKKGDFYLQIDKELNMVVVKGSQEMDIPSVIGDNKKFKFEGYKLTNSDKELLANGHMLSQKVLCSKDGYILAEFGLTEDHKGVKFAHVMSIPQNEVKDYIAKYNSNDIAQEKPIEKEFEKNSSHVKPLDFDDKQKLEYLSKNGMGGVNYLFGEYSKGKMGYEVNGDKTILRDEFLKKYDLLDEYNSVHSLNQQYTVEMRADNYSSMKSINEKIDIHHDSFVSKAKNQFIALGGIEQPIKELVNRDNEFLAAFEKGDIKKLELMAKEGYIPSLRVRESPMVLFPEDDKVSNNVDQLFFNKENKKGPDVEKKVVLRNLDEEFLAALSVRDFKKLNDLAKDDNYDPSKKTLETAHQLPNLSDADKVAIKTIFPEKEKEPTLDSKGKEPVLDVVHDKKNNVVLKESDEREKQGNIREKTGHIVSGAFQNM